MRMVTKKDILDAIGMETEDRFLTGLFIGLACGALVGGITSLLFAPKRGVELREGIGEKVRGVMSRAKNAEPRMEGEFIPTGTTREPIV